MFPVTYAKTTQDHIPVHVSEKWGELAAEKRQDMRNRYEEKLDAYLSAQLPPTL